MLVSWWDFAKKHVRNIALTSGKVLVVLQWKWTENTFDSVFWRAQLGKWGIPPPQLEVQTIIGQTGSGGGGTYLYSKKLRRKPFYAENPKIGEVTISDNSIYGLKVFKILKEKA